MSRIPEAIDKIAAILTVGKPGGAKVIDGPLLSGAEPTRRVYVGYDGDPDGEWLGVSSDQSWSGTLGTARRDETFTVTCAAVVYNGSGDVKAARVAAFEVFEAASVLMRANVDLGLPPPTTTQVRNPSLYYAQSGTVGAVARVSFDIEVSTRI